MTVPDPETEELIERAARGDALARQELLVRHQRRLRQMIAVRMDSRLSARLDPSDVVQEVFADACKKLPEYLKKRPLPFLSLAPSARLGAVGQAAPAAHPGAETEHDPRATS